MARFILFLLMALAVWSVTPVAPQARAVQHGPTTLPHHMAALGDSITRAANADMHGDHQVVSWSTGGRIRSHATMIRSVQPTLQATNAAVSGTRMHHLVRQVETLPTTVDYVTILMGGNDVCGPSEAQMTSVANYRNQFAAGMAALSERLPDARIFVSSNPNVLGLWEALHTDPLAREAWASGNTCQVMLKNPTSMHPDDVARRQRVQQRILDYNTQLAEVCAEFIHCRYEGGFLTATPVDPSSVSPLDYYHPSVQGQEVLASLTFAHTFQFTDTQAPVTILHQQVEANSATLSLTATDNVAVAGIEYRLNDGPWRRYTEAVSIGPSTQVAYRAVDVNGVNEPTRTVAYHSLLLPSIHR